MGSLLQKYPNSIYWWAVCNLRAIGKSLPGLGFGAWDDGALEGLGVLGLGFGAWDDGALEGSALGGFLRLNLPKP